MSGERKDDRGYFRLRRAIHLISEISWLVLVLVIGVEVISYLPASANFGHFVHYILLTLFLIREAGLTMVGHRQWSERNNPEQAVAADSSPQ